MTGWRYYAEAGSDERDGQVGSGGQVWLDALAERGAVEVGLVGVYGCEWAKGEARVGEAVAMSARCVGVEDGAPALFEVWRETAGPGGGASRAKVWEGGGEVTGGRVEAAAPFVFAWMGSTASDGVPPHDGFLPEGFDLDDVPRASSEGTEADDLLLLDAPSYVFEVSVGGLHRGRSGRLVYQDWVEVEALRDDGQPAPGATVRFELPTGEVRLLRTDGQGIARAEDVPPGPYHAAVVRLLGTR